MRVTFKRSFQAIALSLFASSSLSSFTALAAVLAGIGILSTLQSTSATTITGGGYTATDINYSSSLPTTGWSSPTQNSFFPNANDGATGNVPLVPFLPSFTFRFFNQNYTSILIGTNGILSFGANGQGITSEQNTDLNVASPNRPAIAALWDDWSVQGQGNIRFQTIGNTVGSRQFIVQWNGVRHDDIQGNAFATFQATLYESQNGAGSKILLSYSDLFLEDGSPLNDGRSATVGITDGASQRLQWSYNSTLSPYTLGNGKAICFNSGVANPATPATCP